MGSGCDTHYAEIVVNGGGDPRHVRPWPLSSS